MKLEENFRPIPRWALTAALLWILCVSTTAAYGDVVMSISPASGTELIGQMFTVSVNVSGLDPMKELYDYSFDLKFNPKVFEVLAANDGTIFNYAGNTPAYIDGTINNKFGIVSNQAGIDRNASFNGTGGLLGQFTFEALQPRASTTIAVQNVSLSTFAAASVGGPPDINPGTLPIATLNTVNITKTPEPGTGALAIIGGMLILQLGSRRAFRFTVNCLQGRQSRWATRLCHSPEALERLFDAGTIRFRLGPAAENH
jgi:hypothetical protein